MRISDWSSDVCSSDLGNPERCKAALDCFASLAMTRLGGCKGGWVMNFRILFAVTILTGASIYSVAAAAKDIDQGEIGFTVAHTAQRSEEHTSELQSLMRISYAVFCLKKKTQTPPSTPYNSQNTRR